MTMVFLPCSRCWAETAAWLVEEHTQEECDANVAANDLARIEADKQNEEWRAKIVKLKAEGKTLLPTIQLPLGRIVKPGLIK